MAELLNARLNPDHLKDVVNALNRLKRVVPDEIEQKLPERCAVAFRGQITAAIVSGRYATQHWAYNPRYARWKTENGGGGQLVLKGDLLSGITLVKTACGWFAGIPETATDSGGKNYGGDGPAKPIAWYARIQETGGRFRTKKGGWQTHKPRPVWGPTRTAFALRGFPTEVRISANRIQNTWRRR